MPREPFPILRLHAAGHWSPDRIRITRGPSTWRTNADVDAAIGRAWDEATSRPNVQLFDGPMCRLESWEARSDLLHLTLSDTTYRTFLGTNLAHPELADRYGQQILANPVGVSPALWTADDFLLMGRRNDTVAYYPNRIHPFAGALDPTDADPFAAVRRELHEELRLTVADVPEVHLTGIAEDRSIRQPELIFLARTMRTRGQIESALDPAEHHGTWAIAATADGVAGTLASADRESFTPVALAALLLFGRATFGEAFFDRHRPLVAGPLAPDSRSP
jgi:8-oxo-dGTP pyrophosphatase MutT (NUDIX family)